MTGNRAWDNRPPRARKPANRSAIDDCTARIHDAGKPCVKSRCEIFPRRSKPGCGRWQRDLSPIVAKWDDHDVDAFERSMAAFESVDEEVWRGSASVSIPPPTAG